MYFYDSMDRFSFETPPKYLPYHRNCFMLSRSNLSGLEIIPPILLKIVCFKCTSQTILLPLRKENADKLF